MSYSKQYLTDQLEGYDYYNSNNNYNYDSNNDETEDYVDVSFEGFDRIYTYISPKGKMLKQGEKYIINGNNGPENVIIVRGTYTEKLKTGLNYKVLPIINEKNQKTDLLDINNDFWICGNYIIEKYSKNKHYNFFETTHVWAGGVTEENIKKFYEETPVDTFVIFDKLMGNKVYLGNFLIEKKNDYIELAIALSNDIFPSYTIKKDCYEFLAKILISIRDFLLKQYPYSKDKYRISLEHAGPGGYEMEFLGIINSSNIMHVGAKFGMSSWMYYFN